MATYRITGPDGAAYDVTAPDTASEAEVLAYAQKNYAPKQQLESLTADPMEGMGTFDKLAAGMGSGMSSGIRALGGGSLLEKFGLPGTKEDAARLDKPLNATTAGKIGAGVGLGALAAPIALVPGANTYAGAALLGGAAGGALTEGGLAERATGAMFGAAGGTAGKAAGDLLGRGAGALMQRRADGRMAAQVANTQRDAAALAARDAGYVLPPADVKGGFLNEALNGLSGKIKTAQVASSRNQGVTNSLVRKDLGIADDVPLNAETLQAIRQQAGQVYQQIKGAGQIKSDPAYVQALDTILGKYKTAAKDFPSLGKTNMHGQPVDEIADLVGGLKVKQFDSSSAIDAIGVLRETADKAFRSGDTTLAKASKDAAKAMEDVVERHLQGLGDDALLGAFKSARQTIAKTYTAQKALNAGTGDVSAQVLARELAKGKPLSGGMKTAGQVGQSFPKATQALKEAPKAVSPLDYAVSGISSVSTGNPALLGMMAARPATRSLILSRPYQSRMLTNNYGPGLLDTAGLPALASEPLRRGLLPAGAGLLLPANQ